MLKYVTDWSYTYLEVDINLLQLKQTVTKNFKIFSPFHSMANKLYNIVAVKFVLGARYNLTWVNYEKPKYNLVIMYASHYNKKAVPERRKNTFSVLLPVIAYEDAKVDYVKQKIVWSSLFGCC